MAGVIKETERRAETALLRQRVRRRRPLVAGAAAVIALSLAAGTVWVGANVVYYQPLRAGSVFPRPVEGTAQIELLDTRALVTTAEAGQEFEVGLAISNGGSHTVTIEGLIPLGRDRGIEHLGSVMASPGVVPSPTDRRPLEPFVLEPGEFVWVGHEYRFHDCPFPDSDPRPLHERLAEDGRLLNGGVQSWDAITVEFSVRGWPRQATVPFLATPVLDGLGGECPAADEASNSDAATAG